MPGDSQSRKFHLFIPLVALLLIIATPSCARQDEDGGITGNSNNSGDTASNGDGNSSSACENVETSAQMLDLVNSARAEARTCGDTNFGTAGPLTWNASLETAAQGHANDMANNNFFSHTGSDGLGPDQRVSNTGYQWRLVAENISAGTSSATSAMASWLESPGHCANIMNPDLTEIGMACAPGNSGSDYAFYWTQVFATPAN